MIDTQCCILDMLVDMLDTQLLNLCQFRNVMERLIHCVTGLLIQVFRHGQLMADAHVVEQGPAGSVHMLMSNVWPAQCKW